MRALFAVPIALLAACGTAPDPAPHATRPDGVVQMRAITSPFVAVAPDWQGGAALADTRCRSRGYARADDFSGWRENCRVYSHFDGSCIRTEVTRFYPCAP